jgi:hypothetical protein
METEKQKSLYLLERDLAAGRIELTRPETPDVGRRPALYFRHFLRSLNLLRRIK